MTYADGPSDAAQALIGSMMDRVIDDLRRAVELARKKQ